MGHMRRRSSKKEDFLIFDGVNPTSICDRQLLVTGLGDGNGYDRVHHDCALPLW